LAVAGGAGWKCESTMARLRSGEAGVRYLGYVPESDLPALFATAGAFVYPSLFEGFGLPVAQAMACGTPAIISDATALVEIAGDAARIVDRHSRDELRDALAELATSPSRRAALSQYGRSRAERFHWDRCARESIAYFESLDRR
jgi:alpha-1,3-rhamnosyl/mannosyltransferase